MLSSSNFIQFSLSTSSLFLFFARFVSNIQAHFLVSLESICFLAIKTFFIICFVFIRLLSHTFYTLLCLFFLSSLLLFSFIRSSLNETCIFSLSVQIIFFHCFVTTDPLFFLRISLDSLTLYKALIQQFSCTCYLLSSLIVP